MKTLKSVLILLLLAGIAVAEDKQVEKRFVAEVKDGVQHVEMTGGDTISTRTSWW